MKIYVIQLWDGKLGWLNVNHQGQPMSFFKKKDALPEIYKMRANSNFRSRYAANRFVSKGEA